MQNYEPAWETGEIKDEIKRQAFISTSIFCKYFALTIPLTGGVVLMSKKTRICLFCLKRLSHE